MVAIAEVVSRGDSACRCAPKATKGSKSELESRIHLSGLECPSMYAIAECRARWCAELSGMGGGMKD
jgi:hypothetical protein